MEARFLFFTGEAAVAEQLLKARRSWTPVLSALMFDVTNGRMHRLRSSSDDFRGAVYFADVRDKEVERHNLRIFVKYGIPCWPSPAALYAVSDRHAALARCLSAGLVDHPVVQSEFTREPLLPFPYVLKVGEEHRGEGKYFISSYSDIPRWEGLATAEPFFRGESVRVLLLGDRAFGVRIKNENSWIKNSPGATFEPFTPDEALVAHARRAAELFSLEIAGVDYVIDGHGPHFIELNPFPRVGLTPESTAIAVEIFRRAMRTIEAAAARENR